MASMMDMSLDDIIKTQRKEKKNNKPFKGEKKAFKPNRDRQDRKQPFNKLGSGQFKKKNRSSFGRAGSNKTNNADNDSLWAHDKFGEDDNIEEDAPMRNNDAPETGTRIHVGNLSYDVMEEDLKKAMQRAAPVSQVRIRFDKTGRSKGTALVTFETASGAQEAIDRLQGLELNSRAIELRIWEERNPERRQNNFRPRGGNRNFRGGRGGRF